MIAPGDSNTNSQMNSHPADGAAMQASDAGAGFEALVHMHYDVAVSAAYRVVKNPDIASDCAQQAFLEALRRSNDIRDKTKIRAWVCEVARREAIHRIRAGKREQNWRSSLADRSAIPHACSSALESAEREETLQRLRHAMNEIHSIYREALVMIYAEDGSLRGVAARLGVSLSTLDKRLMRGKALLRRSLENQ